MTTPDAAVRRLEKANPVPDVSSFVPAEADAVAFLAELEATPTVHRLSVDDGSRFRSRWIITAAGAAAAVLVIVLTIRSTVEDRSLEVLTDEHDQREADVDDRSSSDPVPVEGSSDEVTRVRNDYGRVDYAEVEPVLGSIDWILVEGDPDTVPPLWGSGSPGLCCPLELDPTGGYRAYEPAGQGWTMWRSDDGITWTSEAVETGPEPNQWAIGDGELQVVGRRDGRPVVVDLERPVTPRIEGLDLRFVIGLPTPVGEDVALVDGNLVGIIPWDDLYGTFEGCDPTSCFEMPPMVLYGEAWIGGRQLAGEDLAWVLNPVDGELLASLKIDFTDTTIVFRDADTGAPVHRIASETAMQLTTIRSHFVTDADLTSFKLESLAWMGSIDAGFALTAPPPEQAGWFVALPDGGVGAFRELSIPGEQPPRVYVTTDGRQWDDAIPNFAEGRNVSHARVQREGDELAAYVTYTAGGAQRWISTDGVEWTLHFQYPRGTHPRRTSWGWVAMRQWRHHVSIDDGASWAPLERPPDTIVSDKDGDYSYSEGVAGDIIWMQLDLQTTPSRSAQRYLWISRFESEP